MIIMAIASYCMHIEFKVFSHTGYHFSVCNNTAELCIVTKKEITNGEATFNPRVNDEQIICPDGASTFLTVRSSGY